MAARKNGVEGGSKSPRSARRAGWRAGPLILDSGFSILLYDHGLQDLLDRVLLPVAQADEDQVKARQDVAVAVPGARGLDQVARRFGMPRINPPLRAIVGLDLLPGPGPGVVAHRHELPALPFAVMQREEAE